MSPSPEPMRPSLKNESKMFGPLCNQLQTVNLKTHSKTLYYSTLKLKYSSSILKQKSTKAKTNVHR